MSSCREPRRVGARGTSGGALAAAGLALASLLAGCAPACDTLCAKLDRCGLDAAVDRVACEVACERELGRYTDDEDKALEDAFNAHRRCLGNSTCAEIAEGTCYDPDLFPFVLEGS